VVKSSSEVVNNVSDYGGDVQWNFLPDPERPELIRGIRVLLDDDSIGFRLDVIDDVSIELADVLLGPVNF